MTNLASLAGADAETTAGDPVALQLRTLETRLVRLETPPPKTLIERWQKRGSFIALVIGILLSGFSLFDAFVSKPRDAALRDMEEFNKAVNAVSSLRQSVLKTQIETSNPQLVMAMNSMATPQILANIQYATALLPRLGDRAGVPQLVVLISEAINIYDWRSAELLVNRAIASKDNVPSLKSEAYRYQARLFFMTGRVQEGRKGFEDSLNALRSEPGFGIDGARAYVVADWIISEFALGDCNVGTERAQQFVELARRPQITQLVRDGLVATLKAQLAQISAQNPRCPVPSVL
jgi:hypothetical protein